MSPHPAPVSSQAFAPCGADLTGSAALHPSSAPGKAERRAAVSVVTPAEGDVPVRNSPGCTGASVDPDALHCDARFCPSDQYFSRTSGSSLSQDFLLSSRVGL